MTAEKPRLLFFKSSSMARANKEGCSEFAMGWGWEEEKTEERPFLNSYYKIYYIS